MKLNVEGESDPRFAVVEDAFRRNFEDLAEVGAALCIYSEGRPVVDLWGGYKNAARTEPWQRETIVCVYSVTKGVTALCIHMLVDRGLLDLDTPAWEYWPEFGKNGKEAVTPRHILSHTAGLPAFERPISVEEYYDWDLTVSRLAEQRPRWEPGTKFGYQALTFGHMAGELIRRISGKSPGAFLRSEVVEPLGGDFHLGIGAEHDDRIAELIPASSEEQANWGSPDPESLVWKAANNPQVGVPSVSNSSGWRRAEIPGANGHGDARTIARIYGALANKGSIDQVELLSSDCIEQMIQEQVSGVDCVMQLNGRMALGYALSGGWYRATPNPRSFGYPGLGGHMAFGDPDAALGFGYVTNQMKIPADFRDPRVARILDALDSCVN